MEEKLRAALVMSLKVILWQSGDAALVNRLHERVPAVGRTTYDGYIQAATCLPDAAADALQVDVKEAVA